MSKSLFSRLSELNTGSRERVGFILPGDEIIECLNVAPEPEDTFDVAPEEILAYCDRAVATWHTHPGAGSNLSVGDRETFLLWPSLLHYIVGDNSVTCYRIENGNVFRHEA